MPFEVAESTLASLEWPRLIEALRACCRTPQGRLHLEEGPETAPFEGEDEGVRRRLRETSEARALLDRDAALPLGGCEDLADALAHAEKGGVLEAAQLLDVRRTLAAVHDTLEFFDEHGDASPGLQALTKAMEARPELQASIDRCLDPNGEVRDSASRRTV